MIDLLTYAKDYFYWHGKVKGSDISRIEAQTKAAERSEKAKKLLDGIAVLDPSLSHIWIAFSKLHNSTGGEISYQEIDSYCRYNGRLSPFEVDAIIAISRMRRLSND